MKLKLELKIKNKKVSKRNLFIFLFTPLPYQESNSLFNIINVVVAVAASKFSLSK